MKRMIWVLGIIAVILAGRPGAVVAQGTAPLVSYRVQPDDTLSGIARRYCTTWQEVYQINRAVIGPSPNYLRWGIVILVPNRCGGTVPTPPSGGVYDRGPMPHAQGTVAGNIYTVAPGDTLFSIGQRFGLTTQQLAAANGIPYPWRIYAGQRLVIPGLVPPPKPTPQPTGQPTPKPTPSVSPTPAPFIRIDSPAPGAVLPPTFVVSGAGAGLFEGSVLVQAFNSAGVLLAQQPTTLQGSNVGAGGQGTWIVQLTVNQPAGTPGVITASSPQSPVAPVSIRVTFGGSAPGPITKTFAPGECVVQSRPGSPFYQFPNGPLSGTFGASVSYNAIQGFQQAGQYWYLINLEPGTGNPPVWAPLSSLSTFSPMCIW